MMMKTIQTLILSASIMLGVAAGASQLPTQNKETQSKAGDLTTSARPGPRTTLLVALPMEAAWQDMAFLAAVPAATVVNNGAPSLVAIDASGVLSPQIDDYLRRYRPETIYQIGGGAGDGLKAAERTCMVLADSADEAACKLSARFWTTSATAVICPEDDYEAALVAAPLAARLRAPLLFASAQGLSPGAKQELQRLQAHE